MKAKIESILRDKNVSISYLGSDLAIKENTNAFFFPLLNLKINSMNLYNVLLCLLHIKYIWTTAV